MLESGLEVYEIMRGGRGTVDRDGIARRNENGNREYNMSSSELLFLFLSFSFTFTSSTGNPSTPLGYLSNPAINHILV